MVSHPSGPKASNLPQPPIFVRADFSFEVNGTDFSFTNKEVSLYGISGLRWPGSDPMNLLGKRVSVAVSVHSVRGPLTFVTPGTLTCEQTRTAQYLGVQFELDEETRTRLARVVSLEGFVPTLYMRQHPRIPATESVPTMPLRAVATGGPGEMIIFDIANLSPNGILLSTESVRAAHLVPGSRVGLHVEPRGDNALDFSCEGIVCRVVYRREPSTGNVERLFGVKFTRFAGLERAKFIEVLNSVLQTLRGQMARQRSRRSA